MNNKKVLIIEDEEVTLKALFRELGEAGFEVFVARDGESGVEIAKDKNPDLILLDLLLPKIDGLFVLKNLKEDNDLTKIPVLILTNFNSMDKISEIMEIGASGYILKSSQSVSDIVEKVKKELSK
jgi:DNA-binding response OmpR family regulator